MTHLTFERSLWVWTGLWTFMGFVIGCLVGMQLIRSKLGKEYPALKGKV